MTLWYQWRVATAQVRLCLLAIACLAAALCSCAGWSEEAKASGEFPQVSAASPPNSLESLSSSVLVVYHSGLEESREVAEHYVRRRGIPRLHLCGVEFPASHVVRGDHYLEQVKPVVRKCLERIGPDRVLYIVLSYLTPSQVMIPGQRFEAALDSLLADIWDQANPDPLPVQVRLPHPYFAAHDSAGNRFVRFLPFEVYREEADQPRIYSVWRLDGPTAEIAKGLVDRAMEAEENGGPTGKGCFDRNTRDVQYKADSSYATGEWDIQRASELASMAGFPVVLDMEPQEFGESPAPKRCEPAALYAGWYSLNNYNDAFTWSAGAIGLHIDSASALHVRQGPNWVHNALRQGITVTAGAVTEPYLTNYPQADGILHDLFTGANVGDAFLRNTRLLKFRFVYLGDPLYRPFPGGKGPLSTGQAPTPSMRVRSPRTLGGVPGLVVVRADGDLTKERTMRLSIHPPELGQTDEQLVFSPGLVEKEAVVLTAGVTEPKSLRVLAEGSTGFATGVIQVLPALVRLEPASQQVPGGSPFDLRLQVGAVVQSSDAPVDIKTNCARFVTVPPRVMVPAGQDWVQFSLQTKPVDKETTCEVTLSKFGASVQATVILTPGQN
ncbi:MAG: TIGR03790 family protein [Bryobacterales bacterium]|nr:TIGR03790 family protein [Bryobacterales bacterium]